MEHTETVAFAGVVGSDRVALSIAPHADTDENDPQMLSIEAMSASAGTGQITVDIAFAELTAGPIKLHAQVL
jgi:hypothetical protein